MKKTNLKRPLKTLSGSIYQSETSRRIRVNYFRGGLDPLSILSTIDEKETENEKRIKSTSCLMAIFKSAIIDAFKSNPSIPILYIDKFFNSLVKIVRNLNTLPIHT